MAAVQKGGDRQALHERIRLHSQAAAVQVKQQGMANDLIGRLRSDPAFSGIQWDNVLDASRFIGRAPQQVDAFIRDVIAPIRARYEGKLGHNPQLSV